MADTELVVSSPSFDGEPTVCTSQSTTNTVPTAKSGKSSSTPENDIGCFSIIRTALARKNIQGKSADIIIESWRVSTRKQYNSYIQKWLEFSSRHKTDQFNPSINSVIQFLSELYEQGIRYSGIGTARSALSNFLKICSQNSMDIGNNYLVKKFMKGVFNKRPALPKYNSSWDPDVVLTYLKSLKSDLPLIVLSQKLCILLSLLTGQRGQSIHLLQVSDIKFLELDTRVEVSFSTLLKQSRPGYHQTNIVLEVYPSDNRICVVSVLKEYLNRTVSLRGNETKLLITTQPPFKGVARGTISRWIKTIMGHAGIDVNMFKPHSTRAACTSAAKNKGVPLQSILKTAGWKQESTFRRFYNKPINETSVFQLGILNK